MPKLLTATQAVIFIALLPVVLTVLPGVCETVPVFEKSSSNVRVKFLYGRAPSVGTKVVVDRLLPQEMDVIEHFIRTSDRRGFVRLKDLKIGGLYEIYVLDDRRRELVSLYLRIANVGRPGISEFTLEVPEEPHVQPLSSLSGKVVDATGAGISNADLEVTLAGVKPSQFIGRTRTDAHGEYSFAVPDGQYDVSFTAPGFALARLTLVVASNNRADRWRGLRLTMNVGREGGYKPYNYSVVEDK
jgi:hypothetical protein